MKLDSIYNATNCNPEFCFYQYRRIFKNLFLGRLYAYSSFNVDIENHLRRQID